VLAIDDQEAGLRILQIVLPTGNCPSGRNFNNVFGEEKNSAGMRAVFRRTRKS